MLSRITDIIKNDRMVRTLNRHQLDLGKIEKQLSTGKQVELPSDDPSRSTNQMFFNTRLEELGQFEANINESKSRLNLVDGTLASITDILQRVRVLTVQGANGIYQGDNYFELKNAMAKEIDQHLRSLIDLGNSRDGTGMYFFAGFNADTPPFQIVESRAVGFAGNLENEINVVRYLGDAGKQLREVERDQYINVNLPGLQALWATNMTITGAIDNGDLVINSEQSFRINNTEIQVAVGDTIDDIIEKLIMQILKLGQVKLDKILFQLTLLLHIKFGLKM